MPTNGSFAELLSRLRRGEDAGAAAVFRKFTRKLIHLARAQIDVKLRHKVEAEDVVQSAYRSFFARLDAGQFDLETWNDLWALLTVITLRKCLNRMEHVRAQRRDPGREVHWPRALRDSHREWEPVDERTPTPEEAAVLTETVEQMLRAADASERPILELSLQGYTAAEISQALGRAERSVRRVRERLRRRLERWQAE